MFLLKLFWFKKPLNGRFSTKFLFMEELQAFSKNHLEPFFSKGVDNLGHVRFCVLHSTLILPISSALFFLKDESPH